MSYHGPTHMYGTFVSDVLISRGDFNADWWAMVQPRVQAHLKMGTDPTQLADIFSDEWRIIRETGGWRGTPRGTAGPQSQAMRDTLKWCAVARRHGFA